LKYVNYLQELKSIGKLPSSIWITSSDNFASWGGGSPDYHNDDLNALINAVDYISMHTYPFHDTHYNPGFWEVHESAVADADSMERVELAMRRTMHYAKNQYNGVKEYMESIGADKPIHIGETGWASVSRGLYGPNGSYAADELKQALYRNQMRSWTDSAGISCFYFEAFDEPWKDPNHKEGSENNFGVITLDGQAKYALWPLVDQGVFKGLTRNGNPITKTFGGDEEALLKTVLTPKTVNE
jgi:exo-beta-1,3-glucanase (GH17 family)